MPEILHFPNLKTVLQVEKVLEGADTVISKNELKRRLPTQIMHQTLNLILEYLEDSGKIMIGAKGITWMQNDNPKLKKLLEKAVRVASKRKGMGIIGLFDEIKWKRKDGVECVLNMARDNPCHNDEEQVIGLLEKAMEQAYLGYF